MKDLKKAISLPCFRSTGFTGNLDLTVVETVKWRGTLSPITATHSAGKNPTANPCFPRHQVLSPGGGMSITDIMSPTCLSYKFVSISYGVLFRKIVLSKQKF